MQTTLRQQLQVAVEVLEFYQDTDNYYQIEDREKSDIMLDRGNFARLALEQIKPVGEK
jgi:hypothetical protein